MPHKSSQDPDQTRPLIPLNPNCSRQVGPLADLAANWAPYFFLHWPIGSLEKIGAADLALANRPLYYVNICIAMKHCVTK